MAAGIGEATDFLRNFSNNLGFAKFVDKLHDSSLPSLAPLR
jgi:hypothetical protein